MHGQRRRGDKPGPVQSSPLGAGQKHSTSLCLSLCLCLCVSVSLSLCLSLPKRPRPLSLSTSVPNVPLGADQEDRKQHARTHVLVPSVPLAVGQLDMVLRHGVAPDLPDVRALDCPLRCIRCACVRERRGSGQKARMHTRTQNVSQACVTHAHTHAHASMQAGRRACVRACGLAGVCRCVGGCAPHSGFGLFFRWFHRNRTLGSPCHPLSTWAGSFHRTPPRLRLWHSPPHPSRKRAPPGMSPAARGRCKQERKKAKESGEMESARE